MNGSHLVLFLAFRESLFSGGKIFSMQPSTLNLLEALMCGEYIRFTIGCIISLAADGKGYYEN